MLAVVPCRPGCHPWLPIWSNGELGADHLPRGGPPLRPWQVLSFRQTGYYQGHRPRARTPGSWPVAVLQNKIKNLLASQFVILYKKYCFTSVSRRLKVEAAVQCYKLRLNVSLSCSCRSVTSRVPFTRFKYCSVFCVVVREPGDDGVVERPVAQWGFCQVHGVYFSRHHLPRAACGESWVQGTDL